MAQRSRLSTTLCGIAGEYFVAAELSRRGYVASLTLRNTCGIDILVSDADATNSVGIQVKTTQRPKAEWPVNEKVEKQDVAKNLFFVFVVLNGMGTPEYYVVPRADVADYVRTRHRQWLNSPGRRGQPHRDSPMRQFADPGGKYRDRWDLLGLIPAVVDSAAS